MRAALALALLLSLTGCGTSRVARGHALFVAKCARCHTASGHESGTSGGDLVRSHLGTADLESFARVMPVKPPLTRDQAADVAAYVASR